MNITIPLHQDRQLPIAAMVLLGKAFVPQLRERATLAFTMINVADAAARKYTLRAFPKGAAFGGFRADFIKVRLEAAYGKPTPPPLSKKQLRAAEAAERYREAVIADQEVSLTNYEQARWYRSGLKHAARRQFVGCRER